MFVLSLMVGSFLNVVIHRVPIMLDREWHAEAEQMLRGPTQARRAEARPTGQAREYNLLRAALRVPQVRRADHGSAEHSGRQLPPAPGQVREVRREDSRALSDRRARHGDPLGAGRVEVRLLWYTGAALLF